MALLGQRTTNIVLQGLPPDVYAIFNHHKVAKEIWDRVKLLLQGTKLSLQEKELNNQTTHSKRRDTVHTRCKGWARNKVMPGEGHYGHMAMHSLLRGKEHCNGLRKRQYPGILDGQAAQITIPNTADFQTDDLDAYDSDYDDVSNAKAMR
ncbi:hypothetical protein Tco_0849148 [Tanacetum coccineum]